MKHGPSRSTGTRSLQTELRDLFRQGAYERPSASLHCHTMYSDGALPPARLIDAAVEQGLHTLSITDHDTMSAYGQTIYTDLSQHTRLSLQEYAREKGVRLIPGVELSCWWRWHPVHLLAYGLDPKSHAVTNLCRMTSQAAMKRRSIPFRSWPVQASAVSLLVASLGGVPVLAHPRFYWTDIRCMIRELAEVGGLMGVETEYDYSTHHHRIQCPLWRPDRIRRIADSHGLIRTGGGDSHGEDLRHFRR